MNIQGENKSRNIVLGLTPLWLVIGIFMIGPLLIMAGVSVMEPNVYGGVYFKFDLSGYRQILFDTNLFKKSLASLANMGLAFSPLNSGVSMQASLIFSPSIVVQVSPS